MVVMIRTAATVPPEQMAPVNGTSQGTSSNNTASWQSAFWAIVGALLNVLLQNAGAVCGYYTSRIFLRSSPVICAFDTVLCIAKFVWMMALGCHPTTAARHVWYDRFVEPESQEGSGIGSMWRLNMVAFVLGALPQFVKVFAMQGVQFTQTLAAILLVAFVVSELFRIVAGTAHEIELTPLPIIEQAKRRFSTLQGSVFWFGFSLQALFWIWTISSALPSAWFLEDSAWKEDKVDATVLSILITMYSGIFVVGASAVFFITISSQITIVLVDWFSGNHFLARLRTRAFNAFTDLNFKIIGWIGEAFALERSDAEWAFAIAFCGLALGLCIALGYLIISYHGSAILAAISVSPEVQAFIARNVVIAVLLPACLFLIHVLFRLLFMGVLSTQPRKLFGLQGSMDEFRDLVFLVLNFSSLYIYYCRIYSSEGTYKPSWTNVFG